MPCSCPWCVRVLSNLSVVLPGTAVAHGNGGTGRVLSDFLRTTRLATAEKGGGYVDYVSRRSRGDKYGTTHGSYVLPIYSAEGVVTHFAGASFSTAARPRPYAGSLSLLATIGASTSGSCNMNFDAACSISSAASLNVAVTAALNSARSALELSRVMGDVSAGRYTTPVVPSSNAFYPEAPCIPRVQCMAPAVQ